MRSAPFEVSELVLSKTLDPFCTRGIVKLRVRSLCRVLNTAEIECGLLWLTYDAAL